MKQSFHIDQKVLLSLLSSMQPICNKRTTLEVTEYIYFHVTPREVILKATDQEISLQSSTALEHNTLEDQSFLVSGRRIFDLVKELDGQITFSLNDTQLQLQAGGVDLALNIRSAEDFPPFPERIENLMNMKSSFLLEMLNKVAFLIPQNNANSALNGMLMEMRPDGMTLVATDGHCLARVSSKQYTLEDEKKWLLPKRAVVEIKKIIESNDSSEVFIGTCGNQLVFSGPNFNFFTKLIADPFPAYQQVLAQDGFMPATVAKQEMIKTLKRANCLLGGQFISTQFTFKPARLDVSLQNKEVGRLDESLALEQFDGEAIESRFYSPYLLNGLSAFSGKEVTMLIKNTSKPLMFEATHDQYQFTYLVMPVSAIAQQ